jgi:hypothetical protein
VEDMEATKMDANEIWNEICFLLSDSIKPNILEKDYENQVIRAIEKLALGDVH